MCGENNYKELDKIPSLFIPCFQPNVGESINKIEEFPKLVSKTLDFEDQKYN